MTILVFVFDVLVRLKWGGNNPITFLSWSISFAFSLSWWWTIAQVRSLAPTLLKSVLAVAIAIGVGLLFSANWILYSQFREYVTAHMLLFAWQGDQFIIDGLKIYIWDQAPVQFFVSSFVAWFIWSGGKGDSPRFKLMHFAKSLFKVFFGLIFSLFFLNQLKYETIGQHKTVDASFFVALSEATSSKRNDKLHSSLRQVVPEKPIKSALPNLFLFIGESFGKEVFQKEMAEQAQVIPVLSEFIKQPNAMVFKRAYTNSSATDVSLPSLLSGVGPHESSNKLHLKPLLWDWARAHGYYTVFISPQRLGFSGMNRFLLSPGPDVFITADKIDGPVVNDNGKDDLIAAYQLEQVLKAAPVGRPVLLVYFSNATHFPFLQNSSMAQPPNTLSTPFKKSLWLTDKSFQILYETFKRHQRVANLISVVTADHGELPAQRRTVPRISSFYPEITNIPFVIHFGDQAAKNYADCLTNLGGILDLPVQNIDIVSFLAKGILNDSSVPGEDLLGVNLCSVFDHERLIVQLNTNEIRQWKPEGFGLIKGSHHFVFSNVEGLKVFDTENEAYEPQEIMGDKKNSLIQGIESEILQNVHLKRIYQSYR